MRCRAWRARRRVCRRPARRAWATSIRRVWRGASATQSPAAGSISSWSTARRWRRTCCAPRTPRRSSTSATSIRRNGSRTRASSRSRQRGSTASKVTSCNAPRRVWRRRSTSRRARPAPRWRRWRTSRRRSTSTGFPTASMPTTFGRATAVRSRHDLFRRSHGLLPEYSMRCWRSAARPCRWCAPRVRPRG